MRSIDLDVPYQQRNLAKTLGARWDTQRKVWYVSALQDLTPFKRWLSQPPRINHRSDSYSLLIAHLTCWRCNMNTRVFGFALPCGYQALEDVSDDSEASPPIGIEQTMDDIGGSQWVAQADFGVLCYATLICEGALARMAVLTHRYRKDSSATTGTRYYMNHCEHCDAKLGDFETIEEFDSPLAPLDPPTEDRLVIIPVSAPIESESRARPLPFASSVS